MYEAKFPEVDDVVMVQVRCCPLQSSRRASDSVRSDGLHTDGPTES